MSARKRKEAQDSSSDGSSSRTIEAASPPPAKKPKTAEDAPSQTPPTEAEAKARAETFAELGIMDALCEACDSLGFKAPTPIQAEAIPHALQGRDLIGLAKTGTGKTAAFALPILQALFDAPQSLFGLVLAPTRELAYQTSQQFTALGSQINVRAATIVGGMDMVQQAIALSKNPHIVVATPGRLLDHLENTKGFSLRNLKYLVLDEADRLLDMDFGDSIDKILRVLPREHRHTFLFSATMSSKVESLQRASLRNPLRVSVLNSSSEATHQTVQQLLQYPLIIPQKHKDFYLLALLTGPFAGASAIIFTRTVSETARITYLLRALGLGAIPLHGQLSQSSRLAALNKFKAQSRDILCATDVAARGLDIPSVDLVLNFDLPGDSTTYVHRVGRTARAGRSGVAISMVTQYDVELWQRIERALGGQRLAEYSGVGREQALVLSERVAEGQRIARRKLNEEQNGGDRRGKGGSGGAKRGRGRGGSARGGSRRDAMDAEEG